MVDCEWLIPIGWFNYRRIGSSCYLKEAKSIGWGIEHKRRS
jgi:hypothetical protein